MTFESPTLLWGLLLVPLALLAYLLAQRRRARYAVRFTNLELLESVVQRTPGWRRHVPMALYLLALHVIEIFIFAFFYLATGDATDLHEAIYHSGLAYTTMGVVEGGITKWPVLSTFEGMVGFLMIGWSSAVFVSDMDRLLRNKK